MKASAEKTSSTTTSASTHEASDRAFFRKASEGDFFSPARQTGAVQLKLSVNQAGDKFEQEADRMADKVMRAPAPSGEKLQHKATQQVMRKDSGGAPAVDAATQSAIGSKMTGGQPLSSDVRDFMEPRFGADFSAVRVHSDTESASLSNRLSARAFTYQNHVFFSGGQYQPGTSEGKQLLAHELTHTLQQGQAVQRSAEVSSTASTPQIQRLGVQDALDYFADKAHYLPGFRMLSIVLGFNPINRRSTDRSAANILRALIELLPGGALIAQALDNHGVFTRAGTWVEQQLATLGDIGSDIVASLGGFIDSLKWSDVLHLDGVWERAKAIFTLPVARLMAFAVNAAAGLMSLIKQAILRPLAALAEGTAAYDLLKAVLGQDPITGDLVPRTPQNLIGGFMKLIGQEEVWQNIQKSNAIGRAWAWFQGALNGLMGFVRSVPVQIVETLSSITWQDVITLAGVFAKVGKTLLSVAGQFFSWAGAQVVSLLEIIFAVVAPNAVPYIKKAQGAFHTIIQQPIAFAGNLVRAGKVGFELFASNIGAHLKTALIKWITGPLGEAGVYIPNAFSLVEIVKLVLSVLGLTWQNIRAKLVKIIPDPVLTVLEKTASVLVTLVRDGPVAAWQEIKNELSELKDSMIAKVTEMITTEVVKAAVVKLVSMLNPAGAVIQAIIAVWKTISFFIEKINQIAAVVASFIDSIADIAAGQVTGAAKKVEQTMANTLTVVIAFLAKFAGLGNIPDKLVGIIKKIRAPIDKGLDKIVAWLGNLLNKGKQAVASVFEWWKARFSFKNAAGESHTLSFKGDEALTIETTPRPLEAYLAQYVKEKNPDGVKRKVIDEILAQVEKIENIKSRNNKRDRSSFGAKDGEAIKLLFDGIVKLLMRLDGEAPPPTVVGWDHPTEDGKMMIAEPLSLNPGGFSGGKPLEESTLWKKIKKIFPRKFVRGHLLNHHVHGGGTRKNMVPITIGANNEMERFGEHYIKDFVLSQKKTLKYTVKVESFHSAVAGYPEIAQLPERISLKAIEIGPENGAWKDVEGTKVKLDTEVKSPLPELPSQKSQQTSPE